MKEQIKSSSKENKKKDQEKAEEKSDFVLTIPAIHKKRFLDNVVIVYGPYNTLLLYDEKEWERIAHLLERSYSSKKLSKFSPKSDVRFTIDTAKKTEIDKNGRVIIPFYFREYANIKKNVIKAILTSSAKYGVKALVGRKGVKLLQIVAKKQGLCPRL